MLELPRGLRLPFLSLALILAVAVGCVDPKPGGTGGTALYVYDAASSSVKVWSDVNTVFAAPTAPPAPTRVISGSALSNLGTLGWGGMAVDTTANKLYLVSESGNVARIERASSQSGALTQTSDLSTFTLGDPGNSGDRLSGGSVFGQASIYPGSGILYVTETSNDGNSTRIWVVNGAGAIAQGGKADASSALKVLNGGDRGGTGVAAGANGTVYGFFTGGSTVYDSLGNGTDGTRLRAGSGTFPLFSNVIIGSSTKLGSSPAFGSLAYDTGSDNLYVSRADSTGALPAVLVFKPDQFSSGGFNQAPVRVLGDTSATLSGLRFIAHGGSKDWLGGAAWVSASTGTGTGTSKLYLWKAPGGGGTATTVQLDSAIQVRGLAFDGIN